MQKDWSIYINRYHLNNWSIGIDYYQEWEPFSSGSAVVANVCQISLLFFNVTITRWSRWT